jgi:hypothetical protein
VADNVNRGHIKRLSMYQLKAVIFHELFGVHEASEYKPRWLYLNGTHLVINGYF